MSVTPTDPTLSITRPRNWAAILVVIIVIFIPTAPIQDFLSTLTVLYAILVAGSAVQAVSAQRPQILP